MERGRYTKYSQMRLPRRKRRIPVPGSFEDTNKYIRCWNCGFIVNVDRDLGDSERTGNYETDVIIPAQPPEGSGSTTITIDQLNMVGLIIENGLDGNAITDYYTPRNALVSRGCKFCGVTNL